MKLISALATLALASSAVAQTGAGELNDCGLGLELCNRVKDANLGCCDGRDTLISALTNGGWILLDKAGQEMNEANDENAGRASFDRGQSMLQLAKDLKDRGPQ